MTERVIERGREVREVDKEGHRESVRDDDWMCAYVRVPSGWERGGVGGG